ncbi:WXG100 family type VII secretion target [Ectobacillus sp. JY-23]|uniref:WXG100 family type VII secretion target n=1 Tax=Ectobacillus sp. JY-23 TaxID=2933872 RepID=UPI001FF60E73|nr:WXG100 family type VII secretion target [Ectobacillus sp. JY-23]UOY91222.1 WXG100 family type VII secretion target [Ectobacillus sp. JY-23]
MRNRIHVVPEELDRIAKQFAAASTECREVANKIKRLGTDSQGKWEGNKHQQFLNQLNQSTAALEHYIEGLQQTQAKLQSTAQRFREADLNR